MKRTLFFSKAAAVHLILVAITCGTATIASAQTLTLRIVTYNIQDDVSYGTTPLAGLICPFSGTGTFTTSCGGSTTNGGVLEGIGEEIVNGDPAQPIDILALQETTSNASSVQPIVNGLNAFCSYWHIPAGYAMSTYQATSTGGTGGGPNALVYNTNTVQLVASVGVGTPGGSSNGEYRQVVRYEFAPAGVATNASNVFYVYVSHYKSGSTTSDQIARTGESGIIRTNSASLPSDARVLYVGDYNISTSTETSYQNIVTTTLEGIRGIDPFHTSGSPGTDWTANNLLDEKTESCRILHYRDDFQVMSSNVYYGAPSGLAYVPGTYHTFGNNGSVPYETSIINGNTALNSSLQPNPPISAAQCYTNLYGASDHLPVVADYTIGVPPIVASFSGNPTVGTPPLAVTFTDSSTGLITNRSWSFGDNTFTNVTTNMVTHAYGSGTFTVSLAASGLGGASTNTQSDYIVVSFIPPVASFTGTPTNGAEPLLVSFSDTSTGSITNRYWDFGDGGTTNITTNTITHTYTAGTYGVTLIASGPGGANTNTQPNYITVQRPPTTIGMDDGDLQDRFGNLAPTNSVAVLVLDVGTNGFVDPQPAFPLSLGATWGTEDRIVGLWDLSGCDCGDGWLGDQTVVAYTNGIAPGQKLQLYWFPALTLASNTVGVTYYGKFTETNSPPLNGDPWVMPLGGSSVVLAFYTAGGPAEGPYPETAGRAIYLTTTPAAANFSGLPTSGTEPLFVTFTDASTGDITNWFWDFGDGNTANFTNSTNPSHTYAAGTDTVTLVVSGAGGISTNKLINYITVLTVFQSWQVQYFGSTTNLAADPSADPDGDGCNNLCEFLSGTDPTNAMSSLHITSVARQGSDVVVTWDTALGRTNVVQVNAGAPNGSYTTNFSDLSPFIVLPAGNGDTTTNYLDAGATTNGPQRYYRIRLQQ